MTTKSKKTSVSTFRKKIPPTENQENIDPVTHTSTVKNSDGPFVTFVPSPYPAWSYSPPLPTMCIPTPIQFSPLPLSPQPVIYRPLGISHQNQENIPIIQSEPDEKYKTELCRNWITLGHCSYGAKCRFAHGEEDLVSKQVFNPKYKSKRCEGFHTTFYCPYGSRCNFIHDENSAYSKRTFYYTYLLDLDTKLILVKQELRKYLQNIFTMNSAIISYAPKSHQELFFHNFASYAQNLNIFKRLPVFTEIHNQKSLSDTQLSYNLAEISKTKSVKFQENIVKSVLKKLFLRFMKDFSYYQTKNEYWETIDKFFTVFLALHPDLKDYFLMQERENECFKLLQILYDTLIVEPKNSMKNEEDLDMNFDGTLLNDNFTIENYDNEEFMGLEPRSLNFSEDVFHVNWE